MILPRVQPGDRPSASQENLQRALLERLTSSRYGPPLSGFLSQFFTNPFFFELQRGVITSCSVSANAKASLVTYSGRDLDDRYTFTAQAPLFRPYNGEPLVEPAAVDSECFIWIKPGATGTGVDKETILLLVQEKLHFEICSPTDYLYDAGDGEVDSAGIIVDRSGSVVIDRDRNVVIAAAQSNVETIESYLIIDRDGGLVFGLDSEPIVKRQVGYVVDPRYFDGLLRDRSGNYAVNRNKVVTASSKVNEPIAASNNQQSVADAAETV